MAAGTDDEEPSRPRPDRRGRGPAKAGGARKPASGRKPAGGRKPGAPGRAGGPEKPRGAKPGGRADPRDQGRSRATGQGRNEPRGQRRDAGSGQSRSTGSGQGRDKRSGQGRGDGSRQSGPPARRTGRAPDRNPARGRPTGAARSGRRPPRAPRGTGDGEGFGPYGRPREEGTHVRRGDQPPRPGRRPAGPAPLRVVGERQARAPGSGGTGKRTVGRGTEPVKRRRKGPADIESEVLRLGGRRGTYLYQQLLAAADAFGRGRDRDALRTIRPVRDALPDAASVRELTGLVHYRLGNFNAAAAELEAFVELSNSVEQHPVLMDCYRARRRWRRVDELWEELAAASPSAELVTEGRIVLAGSLADRGRLSEAVAQLEKKSGDVRRPREHHLRLWYVLADLEERAGNLARARELFGRIRKHDPDFADVSLRSAALR